MVGETREKTSFRKVVLMKYFGFVPARGESND
jgi:hypothetical protein